jgi:hypothetical protein
VLGAPLSTGHIARGDNWAHNREKKQEECKEDEQSYNDVPDAKRIPFSSPYQPSDIPKAPHIFSLCVIPSFSLFLLPVQFNQSRLWPGLRPAVLLGRMFSLPGNIDHQFLLLPLLTRKRTDLVICFAVTLALSIRTMTRRPFTAPEPA